jgi:micrococcal nuclease
VLTWCRLATWRTGSFFNSMTRLTCYGGELAFGKIVIVRVTGEDRYRRFIGDVVLPDGRVLNHELVKAGLAWWYRKYAPRDAVLERLETEAHAARVGLWSERDPVPRWEWRLVGKGVQ